MEQNMYIKNSNRVFNFYFQCVCVCVCGNGMRYMEGAKHPLN